MDYIRFESEKSKGNLKLALRLILKWILKNIVIVFMSLRGVSSGGLLGKRKLNLAINILSNLGTISFSKRTLIVEIACLHKGRKRSPMDRLLPPQNLLPEVTFTFPLYFAVFSSSSLAIPFT
jgi:hypothetical protein